jgi:transposase
MEFAMGQAIPLRNDYTADQLRRLARQARDAAQARRLLAIAAVLDGASRAAAATAGGMDRQTLRDWVIRFNEHGPDGLINAASPGAPPKLDDEHRAFLSQAVEEGPIPAVHGVVRWRACDLIALLHEEFGISVSDDTICPRPRAHDDVQKNFPAHVAQVRRRLAPGTPVEVWFQML